MHEVYQQVREEDRWCFEEEVLKKKNIIVFIS